MTITEILPSLGHLLHERFDGACWPSAASADEHGDLIVGGLGLAGLAARYGTPCLVLDEAQVRARVREFRAALPGAELAYAGKALLCKGLVRWLAEEGASFDVCSAGELHLVRAAGVDGSRILVHGNGKTKEDLKAAVHCPGARIVLDSFDELDTLEGIAAPGQQVLVRVTPDVDAHTHRSIATGVRGAKFGFDLRSGEAAEAVDRVLRSANLELLGLHCHIGSQVCGVDSYEAAVRFMAGLLADIRERFGVCLPVLDIGGGFRVPYTEEESEFDLTGFADRVRIALHYECDRFQLPTPRLILEPGRSIVARAGVTVYRVLAVKGSTVIVDGGMSDNPRPALYGARYRMRLLGRRSLAATVPLTVAGRHCESGDVLGEAVPLPADTRAGDLLAVACTGAYHVPLQSNYNLIGRPPLVAVRDGAARVLLRREGDRDLMARDPG
ncbi:diaminopimelate decarboxylase [Sciscionella marina]|uniref:diaminopimelate decarboxylase n=1 Tax=Sciscionella marina TaxID=508770 RepID=UPI0003642523|nr:diaminopimelate decarboxylase [Sciscionella marina]